MSFNGIEGALNKRKKGIEFEKGLADLFAQLKKLESLVGACRAANLEGSQLDEVSLQPIMETHVSVEIVLSALGTYHCPGLPCICPGAGPCPFGKCFSMRLKARIPAVAAVRPRQSKQSPQKRSGSDK